MFREFVTDLGWLVLVFGVVLGLGWIAMEIV